MKGKQLHEITHFGLEARDRVYVRFEHQKWLFEVGAGHVSLVRDPQTKSCNFGYFFSLIYGYEI